VTAHDPLPRRTPLYETHRRLGAAMTDFAGWAMPLRYGSETAEHNAVRSAAGLFDLSHMGEIEVAGPQAAAALNFALVSDIATIPVGKAKYTMICQPDGGILDDLIVYRLAGRRYLVVANASNAGAVLAELRDRAARFDAEVLDQRDDWALVAIQGPAAAAILAGRRRRSAIWSPSPTWTPRWRSRGRPCWSTCGVPPRPRASSNFPSTGAPADPRP
jgi:aminomethyltransferase